MYEERIWRFLKGKLLSDCGAAGLMGNLYAESGLNPVNLQNTHERKLGLSDKEYTQQVDFGLYADFVHDGAGYGLAQWTFWSRKQNLLAFAKSREKSIGDLETQLEFLWKELTESYASLAQMLMSASSVRAASDAVLLQFERPADQSETAKARRAAYGQKYYDQFAGKEAAAMSNSPLVSYTKLSPNHSGRRKHAIDTISIHCMAGDLTVESCGNLFASPSRKASSNYGIGSDGRIGLYVEECNRSWCTSSSSNDNRAITIEVANNGGANQGWPVSDAAYRSLIALLVDICQRNGVKRLLWKGDKSLIGQVDKQNMTVHRWFAAKACPGDWLYSRHGQIADEVNAKLSEEDEDMDQTKFNEMFSAAMTDYLKGLQNNNCGDWSQEARGWCISVGLFAGNGTAVDGKPNMMWPSGLTREQAAQLFYRLAKMVGLA
ncbi:phage tail tip lysozyme [Flavonifractor plautii]|jgi:hypothetical protein|uniref:N-acetylmuramoyl-L-alanine amidase n=1 Tax=Flavonifractor plautii TaxID=292800 RepID=A0AAW6CBU9_FLAPL|nr:MULTISPECIES: phage tail tip lysozyme [Eubacteriales]MDB7890661.1 phage tail tip lysozyme [Flavonifractor plautii]MDB7908716.1 phage tail tip lysozyme [Flavonifractor plautii]